jgi:hypothetical protein
MSKLTQKVLQEYLVYNPCTGDFTWLKSPANIIKIGDKAGKIVKSRYCSIQLKGERYPAHRLAWLYMYGEWPKQHIDHIDGNPFNNKINNLRECTPQTNQRNAKLRADNKTGLPGVKLMDKTPIRWRSVVRVDGKDIHLGVYYSFFEACCARKSAENKYGFHYNHGRR